MGTGHLLAYLLLQKDANRLISRNETFRKDSMTKFLQSLKNSAPTLSRLFFFSDKDKGRMSAIKSSFHVNLLLCLWHIQRGIILKMKQIRSLNKNLSGGHEQIVLALIKRYFNQGPLFLEVMRGRSNEQILGYYITELRDTLQESIFEETLQYLEHNWYSCSNFPLWG